MTNLRHRMTSCHANKYIIAKMIDEVYSHLTVEDDAKLASKALADLNKETKETISVNKKTPVLDALFAETTLLNLKELLDKGMLDYTSDFHTQEALKAISIIKDTHLMNRNRKELEAVNKEKASKRITALIDIVWELAKEHNDEYIIARFEYKANELGWMKETTPLEAIRYLLEQ